LHPRRLCRARAPLAPMPLSGQRLNVAAIGDPGASGYSADLPPRQWASAPAGSKGLKKILIYPSALLFALLGMSPDIPVVHRTQLRCGETGSAKIAGLQPGIRVATSFPAPHPFSMGAAWCGRRMSPSRRTFENYTVVASALVAELWQTRPDQTRVPSTGVQVQFLPSALMVSSVRGGPGRRAGFRLRCHDQACRFDPSRTYTTLRVVGEIGYHSWLLPLRSGFESRAAHRHHMRR
jgi:hypothetical protein